MGKKTAGRHGAKTPFRESDFAGHPPQEQAELSGSLNQLSQQLASTRKLLREIEGHAPLISFVEADSPQASARNDDPPAT